MTKIRCFVLMGGIWGLDGSLFSRGMVNLSNRINKLKYVTCSAHYWSSIYDIERRIKMLPSGCKTCVVGYSGGGSRLTWIDHDLDLAIGYDPSPASEVRSVHLFRRVLCYYNILPTYLLGFRLGGGLYQGNNVETTTVAMNHLKVQYAEELHVKTLNAIAGLEAEA